MKNTSSGCHKLLIRQLQVSLTHQLVYFVSCVAVCFSIETLLHPSSFISFEVIRRICRPLNQRTLLPSRSDVLRVQVPADDAQNLEIHCQGGVRMVRPGLKGLIVSYSLIGFGPPDCGGCLLWYVLVLFCFFPGFSLGFVWFYVVFLVPKGYCFGRFYFFGTQTKLFWLFCFFFVWGGGLA